jgi:conjugative transfer region protein (TIGR03750 family)
MFDPNVESKVLNRLNEQPPFIRDLSYTEVLALSIFAFILAIIMMILSLYLLAGSNLWIIGFAGILSGWPIGKKLSDVANTSKKNKPNGYLSHQLHFFLARFVPGYSPPFIFHRGSWEVLRK